MFIGIFFLNYVLKGDCGSGELKLNFGIDFIFIKFGLYLCDLFLIFMNGVFNFLIWVILMFFVLICFW